MKKIPYQKIRSRLQTGDLVLFAGRAPFSLLIRSITRSKWSHIGIALRLPDWDMVLLLESAKRRTVRDVFSRTLKQGVQVVSLSERIRLYKGRVAIRQLKVYRSKKMIQNLIRFRRQMKNLPYEKSKLELLKASWDGIAGNNEEDFSSLFCSELVAGAYQEMGLLPKGKKGKPANEYVPNDFAEKKEKLSLLKGAKLEHLIRVK